MVQEHADRDAHKGQVPGEDLSPDCAYDPLAETLWTWAELEGGGEAGGDEFWADVSVRERQDSIRLCWFVVKYLD